MAAASKLSPFPLAIVQKSSLSMTSLKSVKNRVNMYVKIWVVCFILMASVNVEASPVQKRTLPRDIHQNKPNVTLSAGQSRNEDDRRTWSSRFHGNDVATPNTSGNDTASVDDEKGVDNQIVLNLAVDDVDEQVNCVELRSKRYISDGFCRTIKPITEVVCVGFCIPTRAQPHYFQYIRDWAPRKRPSEQGNSAVSNASSPFDVGQHNLVRHSNRREGGSAGSRTFGSRCINGVVKNQRVRLVCDNGDVKVYRVPVVKTCSCSSEGPYHGHIRAHRRHIDDASIARARKSHPVSAAQSSSATSVFPVDSEADIRDTGLMATRGTPRKRRKQPTEANAKTPT